MRRGGVLAVFVLLVALLQPGSASAAPTVYEREYNALDGINEETRVAIPSGTMPADGWPLIILGHGLFGDKDSLAPYIPAFTNTGFAVVSPGVPNGEVHLPARPSHISRILDGVLAEFGAEIDEANIAGFGISGGGIGFLLYFNEASLDPRIKAVHSTIGFPLDSPSQIPTAFDWSQTKPLIMVNNWRDELIPYDLVRAGWREARGPKFLLTRFAQGHNAPGLPSEWAATTAFNAHFLNGDAAALDTLLHAHDGVTDEQGVFEYRLPDAPDLRVDLVDPPLHAAPGGAVTHHYRVVNDGPAAAPVTNLVAGLPASLAYDDAGSSADCFVPVAQVVCPLPPLAPGASHDVVIASTAGPSDAVARVVAVVDAPGVRAAAFGETAIGAAALPFPDLQVELAPDKASAVAGETVTYTVTVRNAGGNIAPGTRLTLDVDPALTDANPCQWNAAASMANCPLGSVFGGPAAPGASRTFPLAFTATADLPSTGGAVAKVVNGFMDANLADNTAIPPFRVAGLLGVPGTSGPQAARAGRTVPLQFTAGADHGLAVVQPGSPRYAPCAGGTWTPATGTLVYDPATTVYAWEWKTPKTLRGCYRFELTLIDGTVLTTDLQFR